MIIDTYDSFSPINFSWHIMPMHANIMTAITLEIAQITCKMMYCKYQLVNKFFIDIIKFTLNTNHINLCTNPL